MNCDKHYCIHIGQEVSQLKYGLNINKLHYDLTQRAA